MITKRQNINKLGKFKDKMKKINKTWSRRLVVNVVVIALALIVILTTKVYYTGNVVSLGDGCESAGYRHTVFSEDVERVGNFVEITCSITNLEDKTGIFKYGARLYLGGSEMKSELYIDEFLPNVKVTKKIIINSVPGGVIEYGCFVEPPEKEVCYRRDKDKNVKVARV